MRPTAIFSFTNIKTRISIDVKCVGHSSTVAEVIVVVVVTVVVTFTVVVVVVVVVTVVVTVGSSR